MEGGERNRRRSFRLFQVVSGCFNLFFYFEMKCNGEDQSGAGVGGLGTGLRGVKPQSPLTFKHA